MIWGIFWTFLVALLSHLSFSHLGFNIGDDGFCLALAQRILWGQIPHLDFSSLRPVGSGLLWAPIIAIFKEYSYLAVRFFSWWQFSFITYQWTSWSFLDIKKKSLRYVILHLLVFMLGTSVFSYYGWNTVDGIFFVTVGLTCFISTSNNVRSNYWFYVGCFLVGVSALFKQNFLAMGLLVPIFWGVRWQKIIGCMIAITPILGYILAIFFLGGGEEMIFQLNTYQDLWTPGFAAYLFNKSTYRGFLYALALFYLARSKFLYIEKYKTKMIPIFIFAVWSYWLQIWIEGKWTYKVPFFIFGFGFSCLVLDFFSRKVPSKIQWASLAVAWVSSISGGYATPITGIMALSPLVLQNILLRTPANFIQKLLVILFVFTLPVWIYGRLNFIYGEWPARYLTSSLDGILPGGKGIVTTENNARALQEIITLKSKYQDQDIAILPDYPGFWINFPRPNPIRFDWANHYEIPNQQFEQKLLKNIKDFRGKGRPLIFLQKFAGYTFSTLGQGKILPRLDHRSFISHIEQNFTKIDEGEFFDVYRP